MGSNASKGANNDELVDNLLKDEYLKTPRIQQVFRAVDRGLYFTKENRKQAYDDTAWRVGNIHLSAPGIYCEVMENLELGAGMSFLNLGSGTGYLNTMAGLLLGSYGINYGVEVHKDVIEYAYNRLEKFKWTAEAIDEYDFCEPKFFEGNCLNLSSENRLYDRVYCGAACPPNYENYMKNLIKIGGILVMPLDEVLVKVKRTSETSWEKISIAHVNFANMILPSQCDANKPQILLSNPEPLSLQSICRTAIREILRDIVKQENPNLKNHRIRKEPRVSHDNKDDPAKLLESDPYFRMLLHKHGSPFISWGNGHGDDESEDDSDDDDSIDSFEEERRIINAREKKECDKNEESKTKETDEEDEPEENGMQQTHADEEVKQKQPTSMKRKKASMSSTDSGADDMDIDYRQSSATDAGTSKKTDNGKSTGNNKELKRESNSESSNSTMKCETDETSEKSSGDGAGCSNTVNIGSSAESDEGDRVIEFVPPKFRRLHKIMMRHHRRMADLRKNKKIGKESPQSSSDKEQSDEESTEAEPKEPTTVSPSYSVLIREKIRALPLPPTIQSYLNFHRTF